VDWFSNQPLNVYLIYSYKREFTLHPFDRPGFKQYRCFSVRSTRRVSSYFHFGVPESTGSRWGCGRTGFKPAATLHSNAVNDLNFCSSFLYSLGWQFNLGFSVYHLKSFEFFGNKNL